MNGAAGGPGQPNTARPVLPWARIAAGIAAVAGAAILFAGLARGIPKVYDLPDHLGYTWQVLDSLRRGILYPRWLADLNDGFGEATLVFYPPVLHMTAAWLARVLHGDVLTGFYLTLFGFGVLGGVGIFLFVGRTFKTWVGALAALAFAAVPYRVFEMYSSGLYSAFAAGCLAPWALIALARISQEAPLSKRERLRAVASWALVFAAVVLTNMPSAVIWTYLVAVWASVDAVASRRWDRVGLVAAGGAWGSLIAGVYLLPAVIEMRAVDIPLESYYRSNFLFQGSGSWMKPGLRSMFDRMGIFALLAWLLSVGVLAMVRQWGQLPDSRQRLFARMMTTLGLAAAFLMTPLSLWAWRWLPQLSRVDMPWRLLEPVGLVAAGSTAAAIWALAATRGHVLVRALAVLFLVCLAAVCVDFDLALSDANGHASPEATRAAIPRFARKEVFFLPKGARRAASMQSAPLIACSRPCRVKILDWSPTRREFEIASEAPSRVALRTYFFPGWRAADVTAAAAPLNAGPEAGTGRIAVEVPAGVRRVLVEFGTTPSRVAGGVVSLLAGAAWLFAMWATRRGRLYQI